MDREIAEQLYAACERALAELTVAEKAIAKIDDHEERARLLKGLGRVIGEILSSVRSVPVQKYPDLEPAQELGEPDTLLTAEHQATVDQLSEEEIHDIDAALLGQCVHSWRKVARVVGCAMSITSTRFAHIPDGYFAQRVVALVGCGQLESQGNLDFMRFSEVRIP